MATIDDRAVDSLKRVVVRMEFDDGDAIERVFTPGEHGDPILEHRITETLVHEPTPADPGFVEVRTRMSWWITTTSRISQREAVERGLA